MGAYGNGRRGGVRTPAFLLVVAAMVPAAGLAGTDLSVTPQTIRIGSFFGGERIDISAEIPAGCEAVVEVVGRDIEEQLLRKGRHWDIWMNVGEIDIDGAPCLYYALDTGTAGGAGFAAGTPYGYHVIEEGVSFRGAVEGLKRLRIFDEFIRLKESEGLYGEFPGALRIATGPPGRARVEGSFRIPSRIAPGRYEVRLTVLSDGRPVESGSVPLDVELIRLPAFLSSLALRHGALHGLLAVLVAVGFGYATGLVFRKAGRGH